MTSGTILPNARELVRRFRKNYVNFFRLWTQVQKKVPEGVTLRDPKREKITVAVLPEAVAAILAEYKKKHPDETLTIVKHMRAVDGKPQLVVEDDADLPTEDEFLSLTQTVTINTSEHVRVITQIFVARRQ